MVYDKLFIKNHVFEPRLGNLFKTAFPFVQSKRSSMAHESFSRCASPRHGVGVIEWVSQKEVEGGETATGIDASLGQAGSA